MASNRLLRDYLIKKTKPCNNHFMPDGDSAAPDALLLRQSMDGLVVSDLTSEDAEALRESARRLLAALDADATSGDKEEDILTTKKTLGAAHYKAGRFGEAAKEWIACERLLKVTKRPRDAKLLSNVAAAQLANEKLVAAAMYAAESTDVDPTWWKGHWYRGQALLRMVKGKPPSLAMSERLEQAIASLKACRDSVTLPDDKRDNVNETLKSAEKLHMTMVSAGCQQS